MSSCTCLKWKFYLQMGGHINWLSVCPDLHFQLWNKWWGKQEKFQLIWQWKSERVQLELFKSNCHSLHKWHRVNICALDSWHWSFQASATTNWLVIVTIHSIGRSLVLSIVHHSSSFSWAFPSSLSLAEVRLWSKLLSSPCSQFNYTIQYDHHQVWDK